MPLKLKVTAISPLKFPLQRADAAIEVYNFLSKFEDAVISLNNRPGKFANTGRLRSAPCARLQLRLGSNSQFLCVAHRTGYQSVLLLNLPLDEQK